MLLARVWLPRGECLTTDDLDGAALWLGPGAGTCRWPRRPGCCRARPAWPGARRRGCCAGWPSPRAGTRRSPEHWYLAVLGVDPSSQGRGFGPHLMAPVLDRCDREGTPAYLETDTEQNVALYERHGFRVTGELTLPGGDEPTVWLMWRDPQG